MRLIDADALKYNMFAYAPPEMMWNSGDVEHKIDETPTVDAIALEWMREIQEKEYVEHNVKNAFWWAIEALIIVWQNMQEANNGT